MERNRAQKPSPLELGYRMPAEWERHSATWLVWPKNAETWPSEQIRCVEESYLQIIEKLATEEKVCLLVDDSETEVEVCKRLRIRKVALDQVDLLKIPTVDSWIRDYGPNFLLRDTAAPGTSEGGSCGRLAMNDWLFNAWGDKYEDLKEDNRIPSELGSLLNVPRFTPGIVLEGGSIDVNGSGLCLTTEQCLLNRNRNPHLSREEIEEILKAHLGLKKVLWLEEGIVGDDTDGHIDDIARFVNPDTVVCAVEENPKDENYEALAGNFETLKRFSDLQGQPLRVVPLPMPEPVVGDWGRLPASYANFYVANNLVLVPCFNQPTDSRALEVLRKLFPGRRVEGIDCAAMVWGMGAIHCLSQQQPSAV